MLTSEHVHIAPVLHVINVCCIHCTLHYFLVWDPVLSKMPCLFFLRPFLMSATGWHCLWVIFSVTCIACFSCSPWISLTVAGRRYLLTIVAVAPEASTLRPLLSRSAAAAAAVTHRVSLPFALLNLRMGVPVQQKICSMTVIKVRVEWSAFTYGRHVMSCFYNYLHFTHYISFCFCLMVVEGLRIYLKIGFVCLHIFFPLVCGTSQTSSINTSEEHSKQLTIYEDSVWRIQTVTCLCLRNVSGRFVVDCIFIIGELLAVQNGGEILDCF